jgi:hypothetical protein
VFLHSNARYNDLVVSILDRRRAAQLARADETLLVRAHPLWVLHHEYTGGGRFRSRTRDLIVLSAYESLQLHDALRAHVSDAAWAQRIAALSPALWLTQSVASAPVCAQATALIKLSSKEARAYADALLGLVDEMAESAPVLLAPALASLGKPVLDAIVDDTSLPLLENARRSFKVKTDVSDSDDDDASDGDAAAAAAVGDDDDALTVESDAGEREWRALVMTLRESKRLPAIVFAFTRHGCEVLAKVASEVSCLL